MYVDFSDYKLGAGMATDLVNTSPQVRKSTGEALPSPDALGRFLNDHGMDADEAAHERELADSDVDQVHVLRQEVRDVLELATPAEMVDAATALVRRAGSGPTLCRDAANRWQWCVAVPSNASIADRMAAVIGTGLLGTLQSLNHDRFRPCSSPDCEGVFVDTSKAGRRRYCMPEVCGNRLNVASHRARLRATPPKDGT
ncbi:CGNR zinc finger domain-containing protein [Streptomyces sp. NPDC048430]|uniref:CGNR zinc finger domain-containing protein n=1 Tax=unclassified Streptomyces TaxID=2593676 RepID=UPI003428568D